MKTTLFIRLLGLLICAAPFVAHTEVVLSEFMASNSRTLADEDGEFSDWIELHNTGPGSVNLLGWSLTDSPANLTQWQFPATNLPAGAHLVVFASSKNRRTPGAPLHTNFRLSGGGEFLALVGEDGTTIVSQYAPTFLPQVSDVSYGIDSGARLNVFVPTNAASRVFVPVDGSLGTNWILPTFDDAAWSTAAGGIGFAGGSLAELNITNNLAGYWKFDETTGRTASDSSGLGNAGGLRNFPADNTQWVPGKHGGALNFRGAPLNDYVLVTNYPKSTTTLTVAAWVWADSRPTWATIAKNWPGGNASHFHFGLQDTGGDLSNYIRQNNADYGLREGTPQLPLGTWQHVAFVLDATTERLYRNGVQVASAPYSGTLPNPTSANLAIGAKVIGGTSADSFWDGKIDDLAVWNRALSPAEIESLAAGGGEFEADIATNVKDDMFRKNASAFIRVPFVVDNPALYRRWILRLRYDDGFVVWLNGQEVARRNAPETLDWNSSATEAAPASAGDAGEIFQLADLESLIVAGTNVLAIQALNVAADDPDFFLAPTLDALSTVTVTNTLVYFTTPTPGSENLPGVDALGPIITETAHAPNVPNDAEDLTVTARVTPAFAVTTNVTLRYRVMFSNEVSVAMFDDGAHGDGLAGDGIFGGTIPSSASTNGQMIRYAITATDAFGRTSRAPLFNDPLDSDQYFGTVVSNPAINSALPVFHWFVATPAAAETSTGTRCSLFYNGEFYDNIFVRIRGGTSLGWPKKSYKIEFNEDHEFELYAGKPRVTEFDFNTTYTDKSYLRSVLVYEHQRDVGLPSPICFLAHLRQNGAFYNVTVYTEQPDKDFLRRVGLDENGSFYKCGPGSTYDTTASFEKKTRRTEGNADLQALLAGLGLTGAALESYVFDNIDVPGMVNFLATIAITQNIDASDKNHFLYRDTEGTREWRMLPWDQDLTFGPDALNTDTIVYNLQNVTSPACASHPFIGARPYMLHAAKYNRLIEAIVNVPRTREMLLRRIRTLSDDVLATGYFQRRIDQLVPVISPDVTLDKARWAGNAAFGGTTYTLAHAADRIKTNYLAPRLGYLTGTTIAGVGAANPTRQPPNVSVTIASVEMNPASGNQAEEFLTLTNGTSFPVDLTGWKISGGIDFTFKPGTVIGSNSALYVVANVPAFRARSNGPRGGQSHFVAGAFSGQLSARGETLQLVNQFGQTVNSFATPTAPSLAQQFLRITELMYHPNAVAGNTNDAEAFEFVELKNISTTVTLNLAGMRFVNGVEFEFTGSAVTSLAPGETTVIVRNLTALASRYGAGRNVAGPFTGALENGGERVQIVDANNEEILDFRYDNNWHPITDGLGFSLVVVNENAEPDAWSSATQWRPSGAVGGSPSAVEPGVPAIPRVVVNAVVARSDVPPPTDSIELLNLSAQSADLSGWFLSDDFNTPKKFRILNGTTLAAGASITFDEAQFNPGGTGFALSSDGDEVWIFSADVAGNLTGYVHGFEFGASEDRVPFARWVTSTGREDFVASLPQALGGGPKISPVVITEIQYHPADFADGSDNSADEFIELHNATDSAQPVFDTLAPANTWRLRGGVSFEFPANITLAPRETVLLVNFASTNTTLAATFRSKYGVPEQTRLFGPYGGKLGNDGDDLRLEKPTTPVAGKVPFVLVDRVRYSDSAPWPAGTDGDGLTLQRRSSDIYGDDPSAWLARSPGAGSFQNDATPAPTIVTHPASQLAIAYQDLVLQVSANGTALLRYQWRFNGDALVNATNATLLLPAIQPNQAGAYDVLVFNDHGSVLSTNAIVSLKYPAFIQSQPASVQVRVRPDPAALAVTNTSFSVAAYSPSPLTYQWLFNGTAIPGATDSTLLVTNVQLSSGGDYTVRVTDDVGSVLSSPATLIPLVSPTIVQGVIPQFVAPGATVTLSVVASGSPFPIGYEWRRGSAVVRSNAVNSVTNFYSFTANPTPFTTNQYRVVVRNLANLSISANSLAAVITLPDFDQDGIIDLYEQSFGMNTNNAADALEDLDGDGMINRDEILAGTDPTNAASYLKVDLNTAPGSAVIDFASVSNRTYSVQYTDGVGITPWLALGDFFASPTNRALSLVDPSWTTNRFYRVVTPVVAP
jgi:hypothetical protein